MSTLAAEQRRTRRIWALAGGGHDRLMAVLRVALPAAVGALVAFLALAPLTVGSEISFVLSKDRVDIAPERMRVTTAEYRGKDSDGQPFQLDAKSAVQQTSATPIVRLQDLNARIALDDGPATVRANHGRYDMDNSRIALDGPVKLDDATGYHIATRDILIDMNSKRAVSRGAVAGTMNIGTFSADRMTADLNSRVVDLVGHARLHIVQSRSRRAR
ncbi:LPS export ABC transporter periplasmic protein LptC [Sphingomonas bacterium]|uniref:LPS export ABC transporter periplasmic protein LptC n=1 Tax=Sphingomonas bacterium TaxID=1895847 RepID=UPI0015755B07|nr:LPS export ABC transporter periplasmic protein LptC [Sphingomonas bacterium]